MHTDELDCPLTVAQFMEQIFDHVRSYPTAYYQVLNRRVSSWKEVESGDESAELVLITDFLNLYELCVYYGVDEAFLKFRSTGTLCSQGPVGIVE